MEASSDTRWWVKFAARTLLALVVLLALLGTAVLIIGRHLKDPAIRYIGAHWRRQIRVEGKFDAYLLSLHPRFVAERVTIGNPPWTQPGVTAEIGRLSLTFDLPWFGQSFGLRRLEMDHATLHLLRDETGRANWQAQPPEEGPGTGPPLIRSLSMPNARVQFDDQRRHLKFEGTVSAQDAPGQGMPGRNAPGPNAPAQQSQPPLLIEGAGELNGRAANFKLNGDPLATVTRERPYRFDFVEESSGSRLTGRGSVPHPFDFYALDTTFAAAGEDMSDLYFLTGLRLPDTGTYHLGGKFARLDHRLEFTALDAASGRSDLRGTVLIETKTNAPSHIDADLRSQLLRMSDLGARAAGRPPKTANEKGLVLPDTELNLTGVRHSDALINFHADAFEAGHVALHTVAAKVKIGDGVLTAAPLSAGFRTGKITGQLQLDASREVPAAELDFKVANLKLGEVFRKAGQHDDAGAPPPLDGPLHARITLKGRGSSIHALASHANGKVTAVLPHGALRSSLAELAGLDLRALGLFAAGSKDDTGIRCGLAGFDAKDGVLAAERLVIDTEPVLVTGAGTVDLRSETLDLKFQGRPKHPRLRVRAPLLVRGTFAQPTFSIQARQPIAQAGGAIALGMLLTPVAAMLAFVDPGLAKDTDCAVLLAEGGAGIK